MYNIDRAVDNRFLGTRIVEPRAFFFMYYYINIYAQHSL